MEKNKNEYSDHHYKSSNKLLNNTIHDELVSEDNLNLIYDSCRHVKNIYSNKYHPIINKLCCPINQYNRNEMNIFMYKQVQKNYIGHIVNKWTAFHNDTSLNHTIPHSGEGCIFSMEFSKNGKFLASTNHYGKIEIWNIYKQKLERQLSIHKDIVTGIEIFNKDVLIDNNHLDSEFEEEYLLSSSLDKTIKLSKNAKIINEFTKHNDWIKSISLSKDKKFFLSGCVSSKIKYWDLNEGKVKYEIDNSVFTEEEFQKTQNSVNTVNSLSFFDSGNLFVSGFRNGYVKVFDVRDKKLSFSFYAHENKLNSVKLSRSNDYFLTCGRDSLGKLWDIRNYNTQLITFSDHKSKNFNIEFNFFNNETMAITGSEDGKIYIYDVNTGRLSNQFITNERCCNIVKPLPDIYNNYAFVFSGLDNLHLKFCEFSGIKNNHIHNKVDKNDNQEYFEHFKKQIDGAKLYTEKDKKDRDEDSKQTNVIQEMMEEILTENGDTILSLIHKNNLTCNNQIGMENLMDLFNSNSDDQSNKETRDFLIKINEKLMQKLYERYDVNGNSTKSKKKSNTNTNQNIKEDIIKKINIECTKCNEKKNNEGSFIEERIDINISENMEYNNFFNDFEEMFTLPISNTATALNI